MTFPESLRGMRAEVAPPVIHLWEFLQALRYTHMLNEGLGI